MAANLSCLSRWVYTILASYPLVCSSSQICASHPDNFIPKFSYLVLLCQTATAKVLDALCKRRGGRCGAA